nr:MAG TPA: hypothetical protein [Caudoviricetes sp.]
MSVNNGKITPPYPSMMLSRCWENRVMMLPHCASPPISINGQNTSQ